MTRPKVSQLLRPKWVLALLALIAVDVTMIALGRWQWHAGRHTGNITNYSYAFQWWAFTVFAAIMYLRVARDVLRGGNPANGLGGAYRASSAGGSNPGSLASRHDPKQARYVAYVAPSSVPEDESDPERARFNQYLSALYADDGLDVPATNEGTSA